MVRNFYRVYLYSVCVALLIAATTATAFALGLLLSATPLRGPYSSSSPHSQIVQTLVAFAVVWLVTLLLGGLHYWLIRRDMATDPAAGGGAVRSYFLNITQLLAVLVAIGTAAIGILQLGNQNSSTASIFAVTFSTAGLFALLEWERRRTRATTRAAMVFQRLHQFGAQLVIVFIAISVLSQAVQGIVLTVMIRSGAYNPCADFPDGYTCFPGNYYSLRQVVAQWGAALFIAACWAGYTAFSRGDRHSWIRQVTHLLAFGYGLSSVLSGCRGIFEAVLRYLLGLPLPPNNFTSGAPTIAGALVSGLVVVLAYCWLYAREAADLPSGVPAAGLAQWALAGVIFAYSFWVGAQTVLIDAVEHVVPEGSQPPVGNFAQAGALLLTGLPFVFITLRLGARTRQTGVTWPHHVFVLVLLAGGVIAGAGGLIIALQASLSAMLGAPADHWQQAARGGFVTLLVGATMVAIFMTVAVRNHYLGTRPEPKPVQTEPVAANTQPLAAVGSAAPYETLESILDALLAGRVTRDQAAARIRAREGMR
ncbi:MAG TPA: hypothetical protein VFW76_04050 [Ktedonobacterales bacterium]|nr:hypothetical protein [Ktedonobacterales bacterium]